MFKGRYTANRINSNYRTYNAKCEGVAGVSATSLLRYGIMPDDDVYVAVKVLEVKAPHLAKLLKAILDGNGVS